MGNPRSRGFGLVAAMVAMFAVPMAVTLHTVRVSAVVNVTEEPNPSPYGYTVSLLLFLVPIVVIAFWFVPLEGVKISKKAFWWTIGLLFPLGASLDFFLRIYFDLSESKGDAWGESPALGGGVPVEEYLFYLLGFIAVLLMYIWLDEYWLSAYTVPAESAERVNFRRLLEFHPQSAVLGVVLIGAAIFSRR